MLVKCVDKDVGFNLTIGLTYWMVLIVDSQIIKVITDDGTINGYYTRRFEKVENDDTP